MILTIFTAVKEIVTCYTTKTSKSNTPHCEKDEGQSIMNNQIERESTNTRLNGGDERRLRLIAKETGAPFESRMQRLVSE